MTENAFPDAPQSIALIDIAYLFKKNWHATEGTRTKNDASIATLRNIEDLAKGVDHVIICRDAPPYNRKQIFPAYKANRPEVEPEEKSQRKHLFAELEQRAFNVGWAQGYEADDVIATLAKKYGAWCTDVRIVCPDKDAAQCVTANVIQYIPPHGNRDWEIRDGDAVEKKFGVRPEQMALFQALMGDSSDNVPGVEKVGKETAKQLAKQYKTLVKLAEAVAAPEVSGLRPNAAAISLAKNWNDLVVSLKLTTLDIDVPVDADALLIKRAPTLSKKETPPMEAQNDNDPALEEAKRLYQDKLPDLKQAAKDADLLEQETDRERADNGESDPMPSGPGDKVAAPPPRPARAKPSAIITVPAYTTGKYGMTTADLQPLDLESAAAMSKWLFEGEMYPQFKTSQAIFTAMVKAKELRIGITAALGGMHVIEGKLVASAMLIRALAERDPNFEYLMPIEMTAERCVWRGKNRSHPTPIDLPYTFEEAKRAGLVRKTRFGGDGNWMIRPGEMLLSTTGSKLARILWPGATLGLYCPEEFGYTEQELEEREAA